ncbi:hypothetical protein [Porphyromonas sp.]|uniref:hypothetical protein n=1 Tax=Porphyromonas sp. TaxID=1924944 RepID=UPI0026DCE01D|nr:hypothetical protein [Porphyromonas sp.]MDO4771341.1 hypothetical protein [Porphyromonas sp.]
MNKTTNKIILIVILLLCLAAPVASAWIDFGGGTDDAACEVIHNITGVEGQAIEMGAIGHEPTDASEPWLFVLQVLIGISVFVGGYILLKKHADDKSGQRKKN